MENLLKLFLVFTSLFLTSCSSINAGLKADPIPNSSFADHALAEAGGTAEAVPENIYPFHRVWRTSREALNRREGTLVYVAPVEVEGLFGGSNGSGDIRRADAESLALYLRARIERELRRNSFRVVSEKPMFGRVIELAIVEVSSTDVIRNVLGAALGTFVPGGGIIAISSSGRTAIEGVIRDASSEKPLFVFADRERGKISPFSFNDFTRYSHARAAIDDWAEQIVKACSLPSGTRIADSSVITLLPL